MHEQEASADTYKPLIGLIIQGPILSDGFNWRREKASLDCTENIILTANSALALYECVVLVTWSDAIPSRFKTLNNDKFKLITLRDPYPSRNLYYNKYRQALTTNKGLETVRSMGCSHAIKIRTDQLVDIHSLYETILKSVPLGDYIHVPHCIPTDPSMLADFYLGGRVDLLIKLLRFVIYAPAFSENTHQEYFFKIAWTLNQRKGGLSNLIHYFPWRKTYSNRWRAEAIGAAWNSIFRTFPKAAFDTCMWRENHDALKPTLSANWLPGLQLEYGNTNGECQSPELLYQVASKKRSSSFVQLINVLITTNWRLFLRYLIFIRGAKSQRNLEI